jgi:hypothetical protein
LLKLLPVAHAEIFCLYALSSPVQFFVVPHPGGLFFIGVIRYPRSWSENQQNQNEFASEYSVRMQILRITLTMPVL